ncbi:MAG: DNA-binding domain-containing protein [Pyrinomonadaceae bacterium]
MTNERLSLLQHWMKTVVTERGGLEEKLRAAARLHGLSAEDVVADTRGLDAHERLGIYARGYVLRLLECMRADFPALRGFVGDAVFDAFARAYIITRPPGSPSLYELGAGFPRFLEETRPKDRPLEPGLDAAMLELPAELARLERARAEVARARGTEDDPAAEPLTPLEVFGGEWSLQATPCLRLLELKFPLVEFVGSAARGEQPAPPAPRRTFVAVGRANYRIFTEEVAPWQFAFLKTCARPSQVYAAVQAAAQESGEETGRVLASAAVWLPVVFEFGFLRRVLT